MRDALQVFGRRPLGPMHSGREITSSPKQKNKKAVSTTPLRPVSDGIKMETFAPFHVVDE